MNPWDQLAKRGPQVVISPGMSADDFDAENKRQHSLLKPMLAPLITGNEKHALDFGCGTGRFTPLLINLMPKAWITGYDPSAELLHLAAPLDPEWRVIYTATPPHRQYDLIFVWGVLGNPDINLEATVRQIVNLLAPGALLILTDHMPMLPPVGKWWQFRSEQTYCSLFASLDIQLSIVGRDRQLTNEITILAGRR